MKNLLLIFLLANILFFMWSMFVEEDPVPGVEVISESDVGPPLEVVSNGAGANVGSLGNGGSLHAMTGRPCVTIGPIREMTEADTAVLEYGGDGMTTHRRSTEMELLLGHWVQIPNIADLATATGMLEVLSEAGLGDAYYVDSEQLISLGRFGEEDRAERVELQARSLDMDVVSVPWTSNALVYFVDIGLPPGRGAGAIVERYGEDKVVLGDAATCPP